jgi:hypothetical protein
LTDDAVPSPTTLAATAAFEEAGLGPADLDVVECQDTDAARELLSYEEIGLCDPGGSAELLESGATALGGRLPVNPSGGLLSKGEPLGASALGQVVELVRQLRGECGPRQVEGAQVALSTHASVVVLTSDIPVANAGVVNVLSDIGVAAALAEAAINSAMINIAVNVSKVTDVTTRTRLAAHLVDGTASAEMARDVTRRVLAAVAP